MAEAPKTNVRLEIAHVLFIDIVGYSARPTDEQQGLVDRLNQAVRSSDEFSRAADRWATQEDSDGRRDGAHFSG